LNVSFLAILFDIIMARKRSSNKGTKKQKVVESWSMYPSLHEEVSKLLSDDNLSFRFHTNDDDLNSIEDYDTKIKGRFFCRTPACAANGWGSWRIAITIRMYSNQEYNARVYHQRCESCGQLNRPKLDKTYAQRVAYRLKRWSGMQMEPPPYSGEGDLPHKSELCEGCKQGVCCG
jgi:hypothetical protein